MNKHAELTRWTPRRLLSLLMALIMTLSLLPTAAFADDGEGSGSTEGNTGGSSESGYSLTIDNASVKLAAGQEYTGVTVTPSGIPDDTTVYLRAAVTQSVENSNPQITANGTSLVSSDSTGRLSVTFTNNSTSIPLTFNFDKPGKYTVEFGLYTDSENAALASQSVDVTVVGITSLTVPSTVTAGEQFTVRAETNAADGTIEFEYGGIKQIADVRLASDGAGIANCTFTAVAGNGTVTATLYNVSSVPNNGQHTKTAPVNVAGAETTYTISFERTVNDANATNWPSDFTVTAGADGNVSFTLPYQYPMRDGYIFKGWADDTATYTVGNTWNITTNKNLTLHAVWQADTVTVTFPAAADAAEATNKLPNGVSYPGQQSTSVPIDKGSNISFRLKLDASYDPATLHVYAGGVELGATATSSSGEYQYTLKDVQVDTTITVSGPSLKQYTVTLPNGERFDAVFTGATKAVTSDAEIKTSTKVVVNHGGSVSFTVTKREGWTIKNVYDNGTAMTKADDGKYTISDIQADHQITVNVEQTIFYNVTYAVPGFSSWTQSYQSGTVLDDKGENGRTKLATMTAPTGYTWDNKWYTDAECKTPITDATPLTVDRDVTVYAKFTPKTVSINYVSDGKQAIFNGTAIDATPKTYGLGAQLTAATPDKAEQGYTFLGWSENKDAKAPAYKSGEMYNVDTEKDVTLYAVWEKQTFNISLSTGTGYSIHHTQPLQVEYGDTFSFRVAMSKGYSQTAPSVWMNWVDADGSEKSYRFTNPSMGLDDTTGLAVYRYTTPEIYWNATINVASAPDNVYTVTYKYTGLDGRAEYPQNDDTYLTQSVGWNETAQQPTVPSVDGYRFVGWYTDNETQYDFAASVTSNLTIYAVFSAVQPTITRTKALKDAGWYTSDWKWADNPVTTNDTSFSVDYGSDVEFTLNIEEGYDASGVTVSVNGKLLQPYGDATVDGNVTKITYKLTNVTEDSEIVVGGVTRKEVKITYYANATDDVEHVPGQQTVKYYINGKADNGTLDPAKPTRVGYEFKGWSTDPAASPDAANLYQPGDAHDFVTDTNLYAIWKATSTTVTLTVDKAAQYEGKDITLTATIAKNGNGIGTPGGSMRFYKKTIDGTTVLIETVPVTGSIVTLTTPVGEFINKSDWTEQYWVEYSPEDGKGFAESKSKMVDVSIWSTAISWELSGTGIIKDGDVLTVYENKLDGQNNVPGDKVADGKMIAGNVYWLNIPKVLALNGGNDPTIGHGYEIRWEYMDDSGSWKEYTTTKDSDMVMIDADHSRYSFRANVVPTDPFTKAVDYDENGNLIDNKYNNAGLYTKQTEYVALQSTTTTLAVTDADNEENTVYINGETPFTTDLSLPENDTHYAQFEGQTITLTAKVTKDDGTTAVETGSVEFYQKNGNDWKLIKTVRVETEGENAGVATAEATMSAYRGTATTAKDEFYAKYVANATYNTSTSATDEVYIKSTKLQTPVIKDADTGHTGKLDDTNSTSASETTYSYNLTGLTAGIPHSFTLKTDGAEGTDAYSVVALDGRSVADEMYTMKWWTMTGSSNWSETTTNSAEYSVNDTQVGYRYHIVLTGAANSPFANNTATSKDIVIGELQGVTVKVEAIDAIKEETPNVKDVYQLNDITLTATVAAAGEKASMKPTGTVAFYYKDEDGAFQKLGEAKLDESTDGKMVKMVAKLPTSKLPVGTKDGKNTYLTSEITAVYLGDTTFKASDNWDAENKTVTSATGTNNTITTDHVTVYSSVVYNCKDENKKGVTTGEVEGIHISLSEGTFKAHEKATLQLSDVYTLDKQVLSAPLLDAIAKLNPNKDYTVQWQKLEGATAIGDEDGTSFANSKRWTDINDAVGATLVLDEVGQDTAYRAVITVKDPATAIVKGSSELVDQTVKGRQVYYSNVMMPTDANMTVSVAINTSGNGANQEGITEGETVTANVFLSGATNATPNAEIAVKITADANNGNNTGYVKTFTNRNTVNGWNAFAWNTAEKDDNGKDTLPGFYTLTVTAKSNTGYADKTITRSLIVRESSYGFALVGGTSDKVYETIYNGRTQGIELKLTGFDFNGTAINDAAAKSWTVKYYDENGNLVEPSQAGEYKAVVTLPGSAYWTEQTAEFTFTIEPRKVSIADAIAQAKVYDSTTDVNIVEVILNDAETEQTTTGLPKDSEKTGIINGDSIYAVATEAKLDKADAGKNSFTISKIELLGDDAANYKWDEASYTESIYVSRSQVYGETGTLTLKKGEAFPADKVIKMIDQSGKALEANKDYTLTFYYHSDTEIKKVDTLDKLGLYTVVARPKQNNYKSGVTMKFEVIDGETTYTEAAAPQPSTLIYISDTATKYNPDGNTPVTAKNAQGKDVKVEYRNGTDWSATIPANAGRYLVRATDEATGDVAYGIYTITKAHPSIGITAAEATYNSMPYTGANADLSQATENPQSYLTYAGDVAIGYYATETDQKNGNVAEEAPVDAGDYVVTLHVNETQNYTAYEVSAPFTIAKAPLTIKADSWTTTQYGAFPDMTATYTGLAAETGDSTPDTSLRDVQIAPEFVYNPGKGYTNDSLDQVGGVTIQPIDALSKNYEIKYENGQFTKDGTSAPTLAIHGLPQSSTDKVTVYYGDVIQLYPYGNYTTHANNSSEITWSVSGNGVATIDKELGILTVTGVGDFTVKLTRGATEDGKTEQTISTEVEVTAIKKEVQIALTNVDKVYNSSEQEYAKSNITVHDELYRALGNFDGKVTLDQTKRTNIGTQITTAQVTGAWSSQSRVYGGQFTINDKEVTVTPTADSLTYGENRTANTPTAKDKAGANVALGSVFTAGPATAALTDGYNRLDTHGYEILVAGTEDMNYNVKYATDSATVSGTPKSTVTAFDGVKFTSKTTAYLNDATVYGETPNALDWTLDNAIASTRSGESYADNLADFDLPTIFVQQDKDDCTGNAKTYKAANRTTTPSDTFNVDVLGAKRTATDENAHPNYTLKFNPVTNSGTSLNALNYKLDNKLEGNKNATTTALRDGSLGYSGGKDALETGENFIEGSANIAQRPVKVEKKDNTDNTKLYWKLPQKDLYTALLNILKAEENSTNRGLAKGHTIADLDLSFKIGTEVIDKNSDQPLTGSYQGSTQVTLTIGDTNYVLDGSNTFNVDFETLRIRAVYYNKTFTGFQVRIEKIDENGNSAGPLTSANGLTFKVLKQTNGVLDTTTDYATNKNFQFVSSDSSYGYFRGTYDQLPLLGNGELYVFQMYEYGVPLDRK